MPKIPLIVLGAVAVIMAVYQLTNGNVLYGVADLIVAAICYGVVKGL